MRALKHKLKKLSASTAGEIRKDVTFASSERSHLKNINQIHVSANNYPVSDYPYMCTISRGSLGFESRTGIPRDIG